MSRRSTALGALILCLGLIAAGCGGTEAPEEGTTEFGAAELRADLTVAFDENAYLTGIAAKAVLDAGGDTDAPAAAAAIGTLESSSRALADMLGSVYGDDLAEELREVWREQGDSFLRYAVAGGTGDRRGAARAERDLRESTTEVAELVAGADDEVGAGTLADALDPYVEQAARAIDELVDEDAAAFASLRTAAGQLRGVAALLAGAIGDRFPEQFEGEPDSAAAELRAELSAAFQEQAYLTGIVVRVLDDVGGNLESDEFQAASRVLDEGAIDLAEPIGATYGEEVGDELLEVWRERTGLLVDRGLGRLTDDEASVERAARGLEASDRALVDLLAEANPELDAEAVAVALEPHVEGMAAAIDALVAGDEEAFDLLREAAAETREPAATISDAIAARFPDRFPTS